MITSRELVSALTRRRVADWVVIARAQELATIDDELHQRLEQVSRWTLIVHHDVPHGRGSARLDLAASEGRAGDVVDQALALAEAAVGPAWQSRPPSAPASVAVFDPAIGDTDLGRTARFAHDGIHRPANATVVTSVELLRERVTVQARSGFHAAWRATAIRAEALVAAFDRSLVVTREARRLGDLGLDVAVAAAAQDLGQLTTAGEPASGTGSLVLASDALLHGDGLGVWSTFADQASADQARQGLTRHRLASPIAPGADQVLDPLTITSNGALAWGTCSAPLGEEGDAVREFSLIERGIATGLGLSMREAARRHTDPNGGVRNLVVSKGSWTGELPTGPVFEVRRLGSLVIDRHTGDARLEVALGFEHRGSSPRPFAGGTVRLDLIAALARAHRSAAVIQRGAYLGPAAVWIEDIELLA